jgi:hypothetical protein
MNTFRARRARHLLVSLPMLAGALLTADRTSAAAPPTIPDGYVRLVDDTGAITVVVPDTWTDVDTAPALAADGTAQPYISAAPDFAQFQRTFDVPGVVFTTIAPRDDLEAVIEEYGLPSGCAEFEVVPYDDGVFVGLAQVGTSCGADEAAGWWAVAANPDGAPLTALVLVQSATAADEAAVTQVLQSFNLTNAPAPTGSSVPGSVPASTVAVVPGVSVPAGLGPIEVATMFLDALAAGDGATACALLTTEEMTINFVEEAETCAAELSLQVAGQGDFWSSVQITGDENTSSPGQCGDEDPADDYVSLELQGPTDDGCLSIGTENGEWRIEDLSNSIWNQAEG